MGENRKKYSAIKDLEYLGTEQRGGDGILSHESGLQVNVGEIVLSFKEINNAIRDMATQTLVAINYYLNVGYSEKEILNEFNKHFVGDCKYKNIKELIDHYKNIAI